MSASHHILIAEDNADLRTTLALAVRKIGCTVIAVADGQAAVRAIADHTINSAVIDMMLPGKSGLQVLQHLKADPDVRVVMISGHGSDEHRAYAESLGADAFLVKPFDLIELFDVLGLRPADPANGQVR